MTGLSNRLHLDLLLRQVKADDQPFSLFFIDMDEFKLVNDTLGHAAGDEVLKEVARRLQLHLQPEDVAIRLSGDEFVVLLRAASPVPTLEMATTLLTELTRPYHTRGQVFHLTASIGVSSFPEDTRDAALLLRHADSAMYAVKSHARNGVRRFDPSLEEEIEWQQTLARELHFAPPRDQLYAAYQPIYDLNSGTLQKVETLLRWTHPVFGDIEPSIFISVAEANGQIVAMGRWVLEEACRQACEWQRLSRRTIVVCVNVSPLQVMQPGFVLSVRQVLSQHRLSPGQLELELTESAVMRNLPVMQSALLELRQLGVKVAVDDFGTGYSSLSSLKELPISCIKIDRSFVNDLGTPLPAPQYALALVGAVIGLARILELEVVAEGIETASEQRLLRDLGCQFGQGYFYSRPVAAAAITALLTARSVPVQLGREERQPSE
ncbi:putative bifunctional diguanylate cyclase/phosphodiesterase [Deinococcus ruber]|uniref:Uncharacterized protein n=1 Tax=Deinococcus ruber TaxID=1848197 RepID=A0A918CJZ4_9DEIO|nr:bifunctional diguanylate cyclase/phosphodiesterase [Deinococcus ruber]GGR28133.1 hypothetical protein GCM10008957_44180 [Deinococcus ruber]